MERGRQGKDPFPWGHGVSVPTLCHRTPSWSQHPTPWLMFCTGFPRHGAEGTQSDPITASPSPAMTCQGYCHVVGQPQGGGDGRQVGAEAGKAEEVEKGDGAAPGHRGPPHPMDRPLYGATHNFSAVTPRMTNRYRSQRAWGPERGVSATPCP